MSQISKCPKVTVVLTYWEASVEVSELSFKILLYSTSVGSYCTTADATTAAATTTVASGFFRLHKRKHSS